MSQSSHHLADEYQKLWLRGNAPTIEKFVSACGSVSTSQLVELLMVDQLQLWEIGQSPDAEQYFARFPDVKNERELAIDLVFAEFLLKEQAGLNPSLEEFVGRFPEFGEDFRRQVELHRAIISNTSDGGPHVDEFLLTADSKGNHAAKLPTIPGYEILGELGRGGIGVVYKARHMQLNRPVAIKMLLAGHFASPGLLRRFLLEAEATARVQHPNIVQIYEVGQCEGRPYLALEYISGGTLAQWTRGRPQSPCVAAALVQALAGTVQFAHDQGVVHRDLKPGNVLLQQFPSPRGFAESSGTLEVVPGGLPDNGARRRNASSLAGPVDSGDLSPRTPSLERKLHFKIADFGLAKLLAGDLDADPVAATLSGDILGTAAYMSPEQARGDAAKITGATDTYSLGAILYELLTGRPPFVGVQPLELLGQVISEEPVRPSHLVRRVPKDIQTICLKCLEKSPDRRYGSAGELAADLGRFLGDQPIVARHTSAMERSWRWCRRHPIKTSIGASMAAALTLVALIASVYSILLGNQLSVTSTARDDEHAAKVHALQQLWESKLSQADALRSSGQVGQRFDGLLAIEDAKALGKSTPFSPAQIDRMRVSTLACLALSDLRTAETWHDDWSQAYFPLSTDQQQTIYAYPSGDHEVFVHRTKDGAEVARIQSLGPHAKPMLSPDGSKLALVNDFCRVFRLDSEPPELIFETATQGSWSFLPSGQQMVGTDGSGAFSLVDLDLRKVIKNYGRLAVQKEIAISPDSKWAALLVDQSVQVIALETGNICFQVDSPSTAGEKHFAWHPNSNILAVGPYLNDGIVLWDVSTGTRLTSFFHNAGEMNFCFNSTGDLLLTYDAWAGSMYLWNVTSGALELSTFGNSLFAISANNEGGFDMLQLLNGTDLSSLAIEHSQIYHTLPMLDTSTFIVSSNDLAYCADGRFLAIASNGNVQIFDSEKLTLLGQVVTGQCFIRFDDEGSLLTLNELGLNRWGVKVHKQSNPTTTASNFRDVEFGPPQFIGQALANANFDVSRNGKTVAVPDSDGALIWSANQPKPVRTIGSHPDVRDVSISADGQRLATGGWNGGKACIWNAQTGELLHMIDEPNCCLIRFSPDGRRLVTNSNEVTIWDAATWLPIAKVAVPGRSVSGVCVRFSPDSSMLAVSDSQACIHLINPTDGSKIATLTDPNRHFVSRMTFSPNGQQLAVLSSAAGGLVHIWDLVAIRRQLRQRNLDWSPAEPITPPQQASLKFIDNDSNIAGPVSKISFVADARFSQLEASEQVRRAQLAAEKYDLPSARAAIRRAIELQPRVPFACNELAWLLTTGPLSLRDPVVAVELAKRAWHDESNVAQKALYINTLGVALYRAEKIPEAIEALEQSLAMQPPESQPFDLYFLSMCSARLHELEKSRGYFEKAESLVNQYNVTMPRVWRTELAQFSQEALSLLGDAKE